MINAQSVPFGIDRGAPRIFTIEVIGIDLTGADLHAQIRLTRDAPGDPIVDLPKVTDATIAGVRLVATDTSGTLPVSWIRLQIPAMTTGTGAGQLPPAAELGDDLTVYWDMFVTPAGRTTDRWFYGPVTVSATVTKSASLAPLVNDPLPGADAVATLVGADLTVTLAGAALIQPLLDRADGSAAAAVEAAAHAETKAQQATDAATAAAEQIGSLAAPRAAAFVDDTNVAGGYAPIATLAALSSTDPATGIPVARRKAGMRRKVLGDDGTGVSGRDFVLGTDLVTWTGLPTSAEISAYADGRAQAVLDAVAPLGKNKADAFAPGVVDGFYINAAGQLTANATYSVTDYVPVLANTTYTRSFANQMCYFDAAKTVIAGGTSNATFTTPARTAFVRMTIATATKASFQLELGGAATAFIPYGRFVPASLLPQIIDAMVRDGTLSKKKLSFTAPDRNLADPAIFTAGFYVSSVSGALTANANYTATGFIPVVGGATYARSFAHQMAWYDASQTFISGVDFAGGSVLVSPANAAFARLSVATASAATFQFEAGSAPTAFAPYNLVVGTGSLPAALAGLIQGVPGSLPAAALPDGSLGLSKMSFVQAGKNLFNPADPGVAAGNFVSSANGALTANSNYTATGFIPVNAGNTYARSYSNQMAWFNAAKQYISGQGSADGAIVTAPAGAAYARLSVAAASLATFQFEAGAVATAYAAYAPVIALAALPAALAALLSNTALSVLSGQALQEKSVPISKVTFANASRNLFNPGDADVAPGNYVSSGSGALTANANYVATGFIPVVAGTTYARSFANQMAWYTAGKVFISGQSTADGAVVTAPAGAAFARLTVSTAALATFQFEAGSAPTSYVAFGYTIDPSALPASPPSNAPQVNEALYAAGQPKGLLYMPERLRATKMVLAKLNFLKRGLSTDAATWGSLHVGDSYMASAPRWMQKYAMSMQDDYGNAGPGWCGFGYQVGQPTSFNGSARPDLVNMSSLGAPGTVYNAQNGSPDLAAIVLQAAGDAIRARYVGTVDIAKLTLHYIAAANTSVDYDFGGTVTNLPLSGTPGTHQTVVITPPAGTWYFTVKFNTGTATIPGCDMRTALSGAYIHKLGGSGSQTSHWLAVDQAQLAAAWASLIDPPSIGATLFDIELGTNDQSGARPAATMGANMQAIGLLAKTAVPHADILLGTPPINGKYSVPPMPAYAEAVRAVAGAQKWAHINMQEAFGETYAEYGYTGNTSGRVWFQSDDYHPEGIRGGAAYAGAHIQAVVPY
ncbi:SGNH/GDSL hydrolase family protein [Sphingomonas populi]|uniref:SGNH/GDSL hydrolase family protein n=1 Tax=Sphingomonas populi TaxID=2484750 RepID=A0A4V2DDA1_9SPHN|nr:SGNH/GDSL hydrolase family protein [Sphingomonas populi]RZF64268.1 SGNH/GDSL hydrolase family protein [Sphingomonas populi]